MSVAYQIDEVSTPTANGLTPEELRGLLAEAEPIILTGERLLTAQAMRLLMCIDRDFREARYQMNQDWFRRLMRIRKKAVTRLRRRWDAIIPPPLLSLGSFGGGIMRTWQGTFIPESLGQSAALIFVFVLGMPY